MKTYIIQQEVAKWTWEDIFEVCSITQAKQALLIFREKHPNCKYRLIYWRTYV